MTEMTAAHLRNEPMRAMLDAGDPVPQTFPSSMSLLSLLPYVPSERDQGQCGDCWAWAGTGVMEIAHNVQNAVANRLSVQLLNACNPYVSCCEGGWLDNVAQFYNFEGFAVPWSNTNGDWTSGDGSCGAACGTIATSPQFPINSISVSTVSTWGVGKAQAIANIKAALNQNQAVWFGFFMGSQTDWDKFDDFWEFQPETAQWTNFNPGENYTSGAGHAILCVGYNDDDPAGPAWIMVNQWGTTSGRPDGTLEVSQNIDYDGTYIYDSQPYQQLYFETLNVEFASQVTNTLAINVNGTGSVLIGGTNAPSTISLPAGETVNLTAQGNFLGWSGCQSGNSSNVSVVLSTNLTLTANFQDGTNPLAPVIVTQPVAQNLPAGGTLALSVSGYGIPAPTFSWSAGGQPVGNGTSTLIITNLTTSNQGSYSCLLSNAAGEVQSASVQVNVEAVPAFVQQPVDEIVALAGRTVFTAVANSSNVNYQWFKAGSAIPGGNSSSLVVSNAQLVNAGNYWLVITNSAIAESATSSVVTLTVVSRPSITTQPAATNVVLGSNATLSVAASGGGLTYIWKRSGSVVQTGTNNTCLVNSSVAGSANYSVIASNLSGTANSATVGVLVVAPPSLTMPPNKNLSAGGSWIINDVCTNVAGTFSWFYNGTNALPFTNNYYTLTNATTNSGGTYSLVLSNIAGVVTGSVTVSVFIYPSIVEQPAAANILPVGTNVQLAVGAFGDSIAYQWSKNTKVIPGATNSTLSLSNLAVAHAGSYTVVVSNVIGKVSSHPSVLSVIPPPAINGKPKTQTLVVNQPLNLSVLASGAKPYTNLSYQWQFGTNIPNATNSTFKIANISSNWAGTFTVVVSNYGGATNASAVVSVIRDTSPPKLTVLVPTKPATNSPYTLTGTASDIVSVTNVVFSLDGGNTFSNAVTTNSWAKWSASLPLVIGTNTLMVVAQNINGLCTTNNSKIKYSPFFAAVLTYNGNGTGAVTGFTNSMQYGVAYTLTAKPTAQNLFQYWSGLSGITGASSTNSAKFTFTVTNTVAATVSFATNQFFDQAGAYNGLFYPTNGATHQSAGFINATITTGLTYSGKVLLAGQIFNISGLLDTNGTVSIALNTNVTLAFAMGNQQLTGTVSSADWTSPLTADLATFSKSNPNTSFAGNFDIVIPPAATGPATNGYGFGTAAVNAGGFVSFVGSAADGTALSQSVPLSQDGEWPLFVQMYSVNKTTTAGEILGWLTFDTNGTPSGNVTWIKTAYSDTGSYADGLTNTVAILSSTYTAPTESSPNVLNGMTLGEAVFVGGNLTNSFESEIGLTNNGSVHCYSSTMSMKFTSGGLFTGKFLDTGTGQYASFYGAALQNTTNAYGYFLGTSQSGSITIEPTP